MSETIFQKIAKIANCKKLIKEAIIRKGKPILDTDTFESYAEKIDELQFLDTSDANVTPNDILLNKIAYAKGEKVIGTLNAVDTSDATATSSDILKGKTAYVKGRKIKGTLDYKPDAGWKPETGWWDIESILNEDTEEYTGKMIVLVNDLFDTSTFRTVGASKVKMSDGTVYNNIPTSQTNLMSHTWNKSFDKQCSLGYTTRYIILYFNDIIISQRFIENYTGTSTITNNMAKSALYICAKNLTISSNIFFEFGFYIQYIKCQNVIFTNTTFSIGNCVSLCGLEGIDFTSLKTISYAGNTMLLDRLRNIPVEDLTSVGGVFNNCSVQCAIFPDDLDLSKVTSYANTFSGFKGYYINKLDLSSTTTVTNWMNTATNLMVVGEITGTIKIDISISASSWWTKETLLKFINALYDYSGGGTVHTLTMGEINLARLSVEEIAIATSKNWTLA